MDAGCQRSYGRHGTKPWTSKLIWTEPIVQCCLPAPWESQAACDRIATELLGQTFQASKLVDRVVFLPYHLCASQFYSQLGSTVQVLEGQPLI